MKKRILLPLIAGLLLASGLWLPSPRVVAAGEEVDVVVNKSNGLTALSLADARSIFMCDKSVWPDRKHIKVLMLALDQPERAVVLHEIYKMTEGDYSKYFLQAAFTGRIPAPPRDVSSLTEMKQLLAENPGAIGYLNKNNVDDTVKVLLRLP